MNAFFCFLFCFSRDPELGKKAGIEKGWMFFFLFCFFIKQIYQMN